MATLVQIVIAVAATPWAYACLAALLIVDGFFPFVPGETLVVTLAALAAGGQGPEVVTVLLVAVVATIVGDGIAFLIGRRVGVTRWKWMRRRRVSGAFAWAASGISARPAMFFLTAKFVPVGRVAVTMTGGATGFPVRRYLPLSITASIVYTSYHVAIGYVAGTWFAANPLLAIAAAIACVLVLGLAIDGTLGVRERSRKRRLGRSTPGVSSELP